MQALPFFRVRRDLLRSVPSWAVLSLCVIGCAGSEPGMAGSGGASGASGSGHGLRAVQPAQHGTTGGAGARRRHGGYDRG